MNVQYLLSIFILAALIGGAQATVINSTVLLSTDYNSELNFASSDLATSKEYSFSVPSNNALVVSQTDYYTEGDTINFRFTRPSSSDITGSVTLTSTGLFTGEQTLSIDGGSSSTTGYYKVPLYPLYPKTTWYYVTTGEQYYFVITDSSRFNYAVSGDIFHPVYAPFKLDTDTDAYINAGGDPDTEPITGITVTPLHSGSFTALNYYESIPDLKNAVQYTNSTQEAYGASGFDLSFFKKLVDIIWSVYLAMRDFFTAIATFSSWVLAIGLFMFSAKVLVGSVVLHLLINIVWCMSRHMGGTVNDLWIAFAEFIDNERKLLKFFKEIVLMIKDLIKWW